MSVPLPPTAPAAPAAPAAAIPPTWTTGTTEVFKTGTWRAALPRHIEAPSPCHRACPVGGEIAQWIGHARAGDWRRAFEVLALNNPFPAIAGRVCHHPCESVCNRAAMDAAVSICALERFAGDRALAAGWPLPAPAPDCGAHAAIVGAGPAGLSAAVQLRRRGWRVTVFEASAEPGGLLRHGIPPYRLPREVLDGEIARLVAAGIELRCGEAIADAAQFEALRRAHDAVFVATGAARAKRLPVLAEVDGAVAARVVDGAAWLRAANAASAEMAANAANAATNPAGSTRGAGHVGAPTLGRRLVVIGGGSAALDVARSARRLGHEVTVLALEDRAQMPAQRAEVDEALEEGVRLVDGATLVRAADERGALSLHCRRVRFVPGATRGDFTVLPLAGSEFELAADAIVVSIGAEPDVASLGAPLLLDGTLVATDAHGATALPGVFAGGDVASLARYFTEAVGMGRRAAAAMHAQWLARGREGAGAAHAAPSNGSLNGALNAALNGNEPPGEPVVAASSIATAYHAPAPRATARHLAPTARRGFDEVALGLDGAAALAEAARCFSCGTCIACDNCITVCPDLAVRRVADGADATGSAFGSYEILGDYCKGCGLCVRECPTGSMAMGEETR